ncbi:hypothetical protein Hanom_Chr07g00634511 [Helianthus anomalus]
MPVKGNCFLNNLKRTPNCELTQLVVDSLLHALQDRRYLLELAWMDGRCGTRIAMCRISFENIELML